MGILNAISGIFKKGNPKVKKKISIMKEKEHNERVEHRRITLMYKIAKNAHKIAKEVVNDEKDGAFYYEDLEKAQRELTEHLIKISTRYLNSKKGVEYITGINKKNTMEFKKLMEKEKAVKDKIKSIESDIRYLEEEFDNERKEMKKIEKTMKKMEGIEKKIMVAKHGSGEVTDSEIAIFAEKEAKEKELELLQEKQRLHIKNSVLRHKEGVTGTILSFLKEMQEIPGVPNLIVKLLRFRIKKLDEIKKLSEDRLEDINGINSLHQQMQEHLNVIREDVKNVCEKTRKEIKSLHEKVSEEIDESAFNKLLSKIDVKLLEEKKDTEALKTLLIESSDRVIAEMKRERKEAREHLDSSESGYALSDTPPGYNSEGTKY